MSCFCKRQMACLLWESLWSQGWGGCCCDLDTGQQQGQKALRPEALLVGTADWGDARQALAGSKDRLLNRWLLSSKRQETVVVSVSKGSPRLNCAKPHYFASHTELLAGGWQMQFISISANYFTQCLRAYLGERWKEGDGCLIAIYMVWGKLNKGGQHSNKNGNLSRVQMQGQGCGSTK